MNYKHTYAMAMSFLQKIPKKFQKKFAVASNFPDKCAYNVGMEKSTAIKLAGNQTKLAAILGISQAAIAQWGEDVPLMRLYQLKTVRPEWFNNETQSESKSWQRSPVGQ